MDWLVAASQVVIALGLLNVWLIRFGKETGYRGGDATDMKEEFEAYGLPGWMVWVVGALKVGAALALLAGLWIPGVARPAAMVVAALMVGAVVMHLKVKDPPKKALPGAVVLALALVVIFG